MSKVSSPRKLFVFVVIVASMLLSACGDNDSKLGSFSCSYDFNAGKLSCGSDRLTEALSK